MKLLLLVLAVPLLTACSVEVVPSSPTPSPVGSLVSSVPSSSDEPGPVDDLGNPGFGLPYACASAPFDVRIFSTPPTAETLSDPAVNGLRKALVTDPTLPRAGWWLTARSESEAEFAARDARRNFQYVRAEPGDGTWNMVSWGGCGPTLRIAGVSTVTWNLDPDSPPPGPESRVIRVVVTESCVPEPLPARLEPPIIRFTRGLVLVAFTARPPAAPNAALPGGGTSARITFAAAGPHSLARALHDVCLGQTPALVEVDLGEALGDRLLVDGSWWPGRDARQPLEP